MSEPLKKPIRRSPEPPDEDPQPFSIDTLSAPAEVTGAETYSEADLWTAYEYAVLSLRGEGGPRTRPALVAYVNANRKS